ncbi:MAG TPA: GxxExxY protein [Kiritimatiellia bacterium]|nr:GxxExxY protein [Kiritimatiellia bacterium]HPO38386.1 GxxExxY protein [Kiritimatiellia bacterium]HQL50621.1 GxxExxY protein [Kiritimatiellia bacterium]
MSANTRDLIFGDEVYAIVGAAMEVSNVLGCGFLEAVYQEALELELGERLIPFARQVEIDITYKGRELTKKYVPDLICFGQIIVEIKALKQLTSVEDAQLLNYLKATGKPVGVLLNFGTPKLEWKRMAMTHPPIGVHSRLLADETEGGNRE